MDDYCIEVKKLSKSFDKLKAVNNISFNVKKGEIFAFLGPNGAGKTTTIRMLTTLLHPTSGSLLVNGYNPVKEMNDVRKSFGIIFQDASLDDELTAYENMEIHAVLYGMPRDVWKKRIQYLLEFVGLLDRKDDLVKHFSGGMKRRLEIARGLLHHPKVLFLDEPTLGLDPQTRNHMWTYIKDLNKKEKMTVFFTTHYMEEADRVADRIAIIDNGKIVASGTAAELKKKNSAKSLEDAFLKVTGHSIREESSSSADMMRNMAKAWGRK
jgi:ABC-2 type transport system ATP-binding protein